MPTQKRLAGSFTSFDFQLVLLRRMNDHNPELVDTARRGLGVSLTQMREANKRWQSMTHSPHSRGALSRYRTVLGEPESRTPRRVGDLDCEAWLWPVQLWPELRFEVLVAPNGMAWNEWLVRAPQSEPPTLTSLADLTPWSCTVDEVAEAFAPAHPLEGSAPTRWGLAYTAPDGRGVEREVVSEFTWGLLQRTTARQ
ncbi:MULTISPECIES: hypothetical protein [unclassified Streptomyces]|uniref:hypothetical protein n=1 Tax=unclassified Streptomyces TaxID=2593676 RepID=UPI003317E3D6